MAHAIELPFVRVSEEARPPMRASDGAAGFDLFSAQNAVIPPGGRACIKTDLRFAIPIGYYGRVAPRSGLAHLYGIDVGAGVIDADYRGNVAVMLFNHGRDVFNVRRQDRIAQLIIEKIGIPTLMEVPFLEESKRGDGGFGSTGPN